jgi:hypothetical protein
MSHPLDALDLSLFHINSCMPMRHFFIETTKSRPRDFKLLVNRSTVASVIKSRRYAYAICMLNILQGARKNVEVLQMIYLKFPFSFEKKMSHWHTTRIYMK